MEIVDWLWASTGRPPSAALAELLGDRVRVHILSCSTTALPWPLEDLPAFNRNELVILQHAELAESDTGRVWLHTASVLMRHRIARTLADQVTDGCTPLQVLTRASAQVQMLQPPPAPAYGGDVGLVRRRYRIRLNNTPVALAEDVFCATGPMPT